MSPTKIDPQASQGDPSPQELGKREQNKLDKQRRIVAAATELFQEHGFEETTTAEIATRAEIGAGTLYLYVGSKEELLVSVFENVAGDAWNQGFEHIDPTAPVLEQVTELFLRVSQHHEADRRLTRAFFKELPWVSESARPGVRDFVTGFLTRLEGVLDEAAAQGRLRPDVPRRPMVDILYATWVQEMEARCNDRRTYQQMAENLRTRFEVALWAMSPESG